jgi:hypothetical protein
MSEQTKKLIIIFCFIAFLLILICIVTLLTGPYVDHMRIVMQNTEMSPQRNYIFCKLLKSGMTYDEVKKKLSQIGAFHEDRVNKSLEAYDIRIIFDSPSNTDKYHDFLLHFEKNRYINASYYIFEDDLQMEPIYKCDLNK